MAHELARLILRAAILSAMATAFADAQPANATMVVVQDVAWSADSKRVFFSAMRVKPDYSDYTPSKWAVYRYDLGSARAVLLVANAFSVNTAPAGSDIVVGKLVDGNRDLYVVDERGRNVSRLTTDSAEDFGGAWSPDGRRIAFTSKRGGRSAVYVANADGSGARRLVDAGTDRTLNPMWSPDGSLIVFYREKGDGKDQIHVVRSDGSGDRNLTNDEFNNVYPAWTPDGEVVYSQALKGQTAKAFVVGPDGTGKRALHGIEAFFVRVSPNGGSIASVTAALDRPGLRIIIAGRDGKPQSTIPLDGVDR